MIHFQMCYHNKTSTYQAEGNNGLYVQHSYSTGEVVGEVIGDINVAIRLDSQPVR